jgi:hypothetical protein
MIITGGAAQSWLSACRHGVAQGWHSSEKSTEEASTARRAAALLCVRSRGEEQSREHAGPRATAMLRRLTHADAALTHSTLFRSQRLALAQRFIRPATTCCTKPIKSAFILPSKRRKAYRPSLAEKGGPFWHCWPLTQTS